ncbi:MAG: glycosyltransferase family 39 protein [Deltaproteobacteria bacterium]|nr:glycosyltransferase family 39 protein [Deltaproteobacteria bacterium]
MMAAVEPVGSDAARDLAGRRWRILALLAIVALAFVLRVPHAGAGFPYLHHWNEPESASTALRMMVTGDLNPQFFNYGTLPIYLYVGVDVLNYFRLMGKPAGAESHLTSLDELEFSVAPKERWNVSHPSFYHWNRLVSVVFGTATVVSVYFLGAALSGPAVGLIAALWLALAPFHIVHSGRITPDALVTFLALNVVLFSIRFLDRERLSDLATAFAFAGLACATKYNTAVMMILPVALLGWSALKKPSRINLWQGALLLALPVLLFLTAMPYAILDLPGFLRGAGLEVRHYRVDGHGPLTSEPGWQQIKFQAAEFWRNNGILAIALAIGGVAANWRRSKYLWLLLAPALYFAFMIQMRPNFHRNFLVLYPFVAIWIASALVLLHRALASRAPGRWPIHRLGVALGVLVLLLPAVRSTAAAYTVGRQVETRSEAVSRLNELQSKGFEKAVIASELAVHPLDLARLELPHEQMATNRMAALMNNAPRTVFVLPEDFVYEEVFKTPGQVRLDAVLDRVRDALPAERILERIGGELDRSLHHTGDPPFPEPGKTHLEYYSVNPVILLVSGGAARPQPLAPSR